MQTDKQYVFCELVIHGGDRVVGFRRAHLPRPGQRFEFIVWDPETRPDGERMWRLVTTTVTRVLHTDHGEHFCTVDGGHYGIAPVDGEAASQTEKARRALETFLIEGMALLAYRMPHAVRGDAAVEASACAEHPAQVSMPTFPAVLDEVALDQLEHAELFIAAARIWEVRHGEPAAPLERRAREILGVFIKDVPARGAESETADA